MSLQSVYDDILEETRCPNCGFIGMLPNGGLDWVCPNCGLEGSIEDDVVEDDE